MDEIREPATGLDLCRMCVAGRQNSMSKGMKPKEAWPILGTARRPACPVHWCPYTGTARGKVEVEEKVEDRLET